MVSDVGADAILTQGTDFGCPVSAICNFQENNRLLCMRGGSMNSGALGQNRIGANMPG